MIQWSDDGVVLAAQPHGEDAVVLRALTRERGLHAGLVRGGQSRRKRGVLEVGNLLRLDWSARLSDHLGQYRCDVLDSPSARLFEDPARLVALAAAAAVAERALPEREPHPAIFQGTLALFEALEGEHWGEAYVHWELLLLRELGFGLDLTRCAGGGNDRLAYVSPKSGRAVSLSAGEPYREKLLLLPGFLVSYGGGGAEEVASGLALTGFFLERQVFHLQNKGLPAARRRLAAQFDRSALHSNPTG